MIEFRVTVNGVTKAWITMEWALIDALGRGGEHGHGWTIEKFVENS